MLLRMMSGAGPAWNAVERQGQLEEELAPFSFFHAEVREVSAATPTALLPDGSTANPECPGDLRIVIVSQDSEIPGVELHLHNARSVRVPFDQTWRRLTRTVTRSPHTRSASGRGSARSRPR